MFIDLATLVTISMDEGSSWLLDDGDEPRFNLNPIISLDFKFFDHDNFLNLKFMHGSSVISP